MKSFSLIVLAAAFIGIASAAAVPEGCYKCPRGYYCNDFGSPGCECITPCRKGIPPK
ncbi:hypothetical protein BGZ83_004634 [Gryganskiella cystojenkinii]|nr:hypothetical protein BGZ83_004634 [Gryganskiella cystojenkinii]